MMLSSVMRSTAMMTRAAGPVLRGVLPNAARASHHFAGAAGRGGRAATLGGAMAATGVAAGVAWLDHQATVAGCEEAGVADEIKWDFVSSHRILCFYTSTRRKEEAEEG